MQFIFFSNWFETFSQWIEGIDSGSGDYQQVNLSFSLYLSEIFVGLKIMVCWVHHNWDLAFPEPCHNLGWALDFEFSKCVT